MKKLLYLTLSLILIFGATSCEHWLDVNTNPNSPNSESVTAEIRLPWIQYYFSYAYANACVRTNATTQMITSYSRTDAIGRLSLWNPNSSPSTTPYQNWFTGAASNIQDLLNRAKEMGATHYEAAALTLKSMGYILMVDLYGEIPYTYACSEDLTPSYDNGEFVYDGCLADLETAIALFSAPQEPGATPLSAGDSWNGGDVNKWIKLCYGLKARWLNNMSKTERYNPTDILAALDKSLTSNADNVKISHTNTSKADYNFTVGDAYGPNVIWDVAAWGYNYKLCKWYIDLLTNFKGTGVEDPRADKLIPSAMHNVQFDEAGTRIVSYDWHRVHGVNTAGIDEGWKENRLNISNMERNFALATADVTKSYAVADVNKYFVSPEAFAELMRHYYPEGNATIEVTESAVVVTFHRGAIYANTTNPATALDITYGLTRSEGILETSGLSATDMNCYRVNSGDAISRSTGFVQGTGTFYARPDSDTDLFTYSEVCFIKAEVFFRQGKKAEALAAYKEGIKANFARMNEKLETWKGIGCCKTERGFDVSFAYAPMPQEDIDAYMSSAAVKQTAAELTLSDIMMQKLIALGFNYQNWNDMRRYNYNAGNIGDYGVIYTELATPKYRTGDASIFSTDTKSDLYYVRRWLQSSHETNYNSAEVNKSVEQYKQYGVESALDYRIYSIPVWWDWTK